jgi:tRNA nucleotidyltransferase (CCA-adding enzyme)
MLNKKINEIAVAVRDAGGRAVLVGGYVRDSLLGLTAKDADLECYGIEADKLHKSISKCGKVYTVGASFGVYKVTWFEEDKYYDIDISIPRSDEKSGIGHGGFTIKGNPNASFYDAASRRDFTINTIMKDPLTGEFIDPFNGIEDLQKKIIKVTDPNHFGEDSLRVLRAMQFQSRFQFNLDEDTINLCRTIDLSDLPKERIWEEYKKMLLKSPRPSIGVVAGDVLGINIKLFPQLKDRVIWESGFRYVLDDLAKRTEDYSDFERLTCLLGWITHNVDEHDRESFLDAVGVISEGLNVKEAVMSMAEEADTPFVFRYDEMDNEKGYATVGDYRRLAGRLKFYPLLLSVMANSVEDGTGNYFAEKMSQYGVFDGPMEPILMGRHLLEAGFEPNSEMGIILKVVYEKQLDDEITSLEEALKFAVEVRNGRRKELASQSS